MSQSTATPITESLIGILHNDYDDKAMKAEMHQRHEIEQQNRVDGGTLVPTASHCTVRTGRVYGAT